jgi:hypothetical protein
VQGAVGRVPGTAIPIPQPAEGGLEPECNAELVEGGVDVLKGCVDGLW